MSDKPGRSKVIRAHLEPEVLARIDALAGVLAKGGRPATRAEILRALVVVGLEEEERRHAVSRAAKRRGKD